MLLKTSVLIFFKMKSYISDKFYLNNYAKAAWRDQRNNQFLYYVNILRKLSLFKQDHRLLDVGCGSGELSQILNEQFKMDVTGVEINKVALDQARKKGLKAVYADLENKWPFKNSEFDLVIGVEIIEHLVDPDHFIQEAKRILKSDGDFNINNSKLG